MFVFDVGWGGDPPPATVPVDKVDIFELLHFLNKAKWGKGLSYGVGGAASFYVHVKHRPFPTEYVFSVSQ